MTMSRVEANSLKITGNEAYDIGTTLLKCGI